MYRVLNYGVRGLPLHEYCKKIECAAIQEGDTVLCIFSGRLDRERREEFLGHRRQLFDLTEYFYRPHGYGEIFYDSCHFNFKGFRVVADIIFRALFVGGIDTKQMLQRKKIITEYYENKKNSVTNTEEFITYLNSLDKYKHVVNKDQTLVNGAIVINANPFTLGHFHLANLAAQMVDYLYIFVVEEDKSVFSFRDRLELVKQGTKELKNVKVIPGGKFIISNITFPEYFDKDNLQETAINPSLDIDIFGEHIARRLGITIRFAGEEPNDAVTCQYNQFMRERLPLYGIRFIEIPRLMKGGSAVSAKKVREWLFMGRLDKAKAFVPVETGNYMEMHREELCNAMNLQHS